MAVTVKVNKKEEVNELLGTLLAWGTIAFLIGKLLGFKFNLESNDKMTKWGVQLGDAFKYSRQKLKNSGIPMDQQNMIDMILRNSDNKIRRMVQDEAERIRSGGTRSTTIDVDIEKECDEAVSKITRIIKDKRHAEEYVAPLRQTFDQLNRGLDATRTESAMRVFASDPDITRHIEAAFTVGGTAPDPAIVTAVRDSIAARVGRAMSPSP